MPPFLTFWQLSHALFLKPFNCLRPDWGPQYTSVTSGRVADIRKNKDSNKHANVHPRSQGKGWQQWRLGEEVREGQDLFWGVSIRNLQCTDWLAARGAWLCWACLSCTKYSWWDIGDESRELDTMMTWEAKSRRKKNELSKAAQLKWKPTALPLQFHGTVLQSPVKIRVPWGLGNCLVSPVRQTQGI